MTAMRTEVKAVLVSLEDAGALEECVRFLVACRRIALLNGYGRGFERPEVSDEWDRLISAPRSIVERYRGRE